MTELSINIYVELSDELSELLHRLIDAIEGNKDEDEDKTNIPD